MKIRKRLPVLVAAATLGDAAKAQGWTALVLDTDGNGKRDAYVEPDQPVDPQKDKRIPGGFRAERWQH